LFLVAGRFHDVFLLLQVGSFIFASSCSMRPSYVIMKLSRVTLVESSGR
jgi:hypothetical protein